MLPSTPQVEAVYLDPTNGMLAGLQELPSNTPSIPSSTHPNIGPESSPSESMSSNTTVSQPSLSSEAPPEPPHTLLIDQTTLDPTTAARIAQTIQASTSGRALMLDAPVSGGTSLPVRSLYDRDR